MESLVVVVEVGIWYFSLKLQWKKEENSIRVESGSVAEKVQPA